MTARFIDLGKNATLELGVMLEEGQRFLMQGSSGAGKSRTQRLILEGLPPAFQQVIFDVEDEMHTLRSADRPYAILGGEYSDAPGLEDMDPAELSEAILRLGTNVIFQINDWGVKRQAEFIDGYLSGLMRAPRDLWRPIVVVLDEAHRYAPQRGSAVSHDAIWQLATAGRKRLFSVMFATPRISDFSASVRGSCNNKLLGRVDSSLDRKTTAEELGVAPSSAEAKALDTLQNGQFWLKGPAFGRELQLVQLKPSITKPPRAGVASPPAAAPEKLMKALAALVRASADEKPAKTSGEVRVEYRTDPDALAKAKSDGVAIGKEIGTAETFDNLFRIMREQRELMEAGGSGPGAVGSDEATSPSRPAEPATRPTERHRRLAEKGRQSAPRPAPRGSGGGVAADRVKDALVWWASVGWQTPTREMLAEALNVSPNDRGFTSALGSLLADVAVRFSVPSGVSLVTPAAGPKGSGSVVQALRSKLSGQMLAMYDVLLGSGEVSRVQLFKACGLHDNGRSRANISSLAKLGVITTDKSGVSLSPWARGEKVRT